MNKRLKKAVAAANSIAAMETRDHSKNGASPKILMSRGNSKKVISNECKN
jgi:hypothetical protein